MSKHTWKLSHEDRRLIRECRKKRLQAFKDTEGYTINALAEKFDVSPRTIDKVCHGIKLD